jgi:two-component system chemotaxis sensor kinase CheA
MPLTLAIIDGFLVGVGDRSYVVPLDMVVECADRPEGGSSGIVNLRGEALPLIRLRENFGIDGDPPLHESIVVVEYGGRRAGLVVEKLRGEFQTVIKPLSRLFAKVPGVGGSTILGNGEVALILDIPAIVQRVERMESGLSAEFWNGRARTESKEFSHAL